MQRIGVYPGTFNPIHEGHIAFACQAIIQCKLDKVILLPERAPRGKYGVASFEARVSYIQQKVNDLQNIEIRIVKVVPQTLPSVRQELCSDFEGNTAVLLVGSDMAATLHKWEGIGSFLKSYELCVGLRGAETQESTAVYINNLEKLLQQHVTYHVIDTPHKYVSSTAIRAQPGYAPLE